jgi:hypothetical protein
LPCDLEAQCLPPGARNSFEFATLAWHFAIIASTGVHNATRARFPPLADCKEKYWWRAARRILVHDRARFATGRAHFKLFITGHYFNCFARDHHAAQCRDPYRCWKCKKIGHVLSHYKKFTSLFPLGSSNKDIGHSTFQAQESSLVLYPSSPSCPVSSALPFQ